MMTDTGLKTDYILTCDATDPFLDLYDRRVTLRRVRFRVIKAKMIVLEETMNQRREP